MKKLKFYVFTGIIAFIWACQSDMPEPLKEDGLGWQLSYEEEALLNSSNEMSFNLLHYLNQKNEDENLFFSPIGIGNGIGIALNVINDDSNIALKKFLEIEEVSDVEVNKAYSQLSELFGKDKTNNHFSNANSLWLNYDYTLNKGISNQLMAYYSADVEYLDFDKSKHIKAINNWASRRTDGDIRTIVKNLDSENESYLINLMKLSPEWTFVADSERTDPFFFTNSNGVEKSVSAHKLEAGQYKIYEDESIRLIDIPYGDYKFKFTIVQSLGGIPAKNFSELSLDQLTSYLTDAKHTLAEIILPQFRIENELKLKEVFPDLVLDQNKNNGQEDDINSISEFIHKTTIQIRGSGSLNPDQSNDETALSTNYNNPVYVDRPFIFFIREKLTGAIVFVGKVNDPSLQ
ncbi:serpin family protein [Bacteroidota bacterium]